MDRGKTDQERLSGKNIAEGVLSVAGFLILIAFVITMMVGLLAQAT